MDPKSVSASYQAEVSQLSHSRVKVLLELSELEAWALLTQIQLASRQPQNVSDLRQLAERIGRGLQAAVAVSPVMQQVAESGWAAEVA